jgi:Flp pilus assembly protein TadG
MHEKKPRKSWRGAALPETALTMGLFFLLLFGSINMAFLGYNQMQADGATYVAARAAAANPTGAPSAAASAVAAVFPRVPAGAVTVTQVGGLVQAVYSGTSPGLLLLGNKGTGNFNIYSREVETSFGSSGAIGTAIGSQYPYAVGSSGLVTLKNYPSTYSIWLAQTIKIVASGSCHNGNLGTKSTTTCYEADEFAAHCEGYSALKFTASDKTIPATPSPTNAREKELLRPTNWDPNTSGSKNSIIYGWDASPHTYTTPKYGVKAIVTGGTLTAAC